MNLPKDFVDKYLEKAKGSLFMGCKLEDLTREELIAAAVCGWEAEKSSREQGARDVRFLTEFISPRNSS